MNPNLLMNSRAVAQDHREFINKFGFMRDRRAAPANRDQHDVAESTDQFEQDFAVFFALNERARHNLIWLVRQPPAPAPLSISHVLKITSAKRVIFGYKRMCRQ